MAEDAILLQRPGTVSLERQIAACMPFLIDNEYRLVGYASSHIDAVGLVLAGAAKVVVAATPAGDDDRLRLLLRKAHPHGRLEVCRPGPSRADRLELDTSGVIVFLHDRHRPVDEIASVLRTPPERVQATIYRSRCRG